MGNKTESNQADEQHRIQCSIKESILPITRTLRCYVNLKYLVVHEVSVSIAEC